MSMKIFYSWQNDSPKKTNRHFVQKALDMAIKDLRRDLDVEEATREGLELDKDTKGVPGTPPIVDVIFEKISQAAAFVADMTFVGSTKGGRHVPNPNVLIEYGWALKALGPGRMIPVMNTAFGDPAAIDLPFDMRHLRRPMTYSLAPHADSATVKKVKTELARQLKAALKLIVEEAHDAETVKTYEPVQAILDDSTFLDPQEMLPVSNRFGQTAQAHSPSGERLFLRLIPSRPIHLSTTKEMHDLVVSFLRPLGDRLPSINHGRNKYGAYAYTYSTEENEILNMSQLFPSGEIWGIDAYTIGLRFGGSDRGIASGSFVYPVIERALATALKNYLDFACNTLHLKLPLTCIVGATNVAGYQLSDDNTFRDKVCHADRVVEELQISDCAIPARDLLEPFHVKFWGECGQDYTRQ